jgi:hypothetical protein
MNTKLLQDLELAIELDELKQLDLTEEELEGFVDLFIGNWELEHGTFDN